MSREPKQNPWLAAVRRTACTWAVLRTAANPFTSHRSFPWWLWPNLLALDAPLVAVVWQRFLAERLGVSVSAAMSAVLALTVWGIYLADRWLDACRGFAVDHADRHHFAGRHARPIVFTALLSLLVAAMLAVTTLSPAILSAGGLVALLTTMYFTAVHARWLPDVGGEKELFVGILFAVGVGLPVLMERPYEWPAVLALAGLAVTNCSLIASWETGRGALRGGLPILGGVVALVAAGFCESNVAWAVIIACVLLTGLHLLRGNLRLVRVLADVALLTPLLVEFIP